MPVPYRELIKFGRVTWFDADTAREKMIPAQRVFLDRLTAAALPE